jgi:hypothetical protein
MFIENNIDIQIRAIKILKSSLKNLRKTNIKIESKSASTTIALL